LQKKQKYQTFCTFAKIQVEEVARTTDMTGEDIIEKGMENLAVVMKMAVVMGEKIDIGKEAQEPVKVR